MAIRFKKRLIQSDLVFDRLTQPVVQNIIVDPIVDAGTGIMTADVYIDNSGDIYIDNSGDIYVE